MRGAPCRWGGCCRTRAGASSRKRSAAGCRSPRTRENPHKKGLAMFLKHLRAPAALASLLAAGNALADYHFDILDPASPMAQDAYDLHFGVLIVCRSEERRVGEEAG